MATPPLSDSTKKGKPWGLALEKAARHLLLVSSALSCRLAVHLGPKVATVLSQGVNVVS